MNRIPLHILLLVAPIATIATSAMAQNTRSIQRVPRAIAEQPTNQTPMPMELAQPYRQLLEISIFARDRHASIDPVERTTVTPRLNPENYLVFRGMADDGQRILAFFVDSRDDSSVRVRIDDTLANGKIADITTSQIMYQPKDGSESRWVDLGCNLAGMQIEPVNHSLMPASGPADGNRRGGFNAGPDSATRLAPTRGGRAGRTGGARGGRRRGGGAADPYAVDN